jgi:hypothetical protein
MVAQASELTEDGWDEAIRFCWAAGWEPKDDEPDVYVKATDTEVYILREVQSSKALDDTGSIDLRGVS